MAERSSGQELTSAPDEAEQARLEIERTRASMGKTLDSIGDRLSPERFKNEAVEAVEHIKGEAIDTAEHLKVAAVEAARAATQEVISGVRNATQGAYDSARNRVNQTKIEIEGAGMSVIRTIKNNPIPSAMVGMGLYWLYQSMQESEVRVPRSRLGSTYEPSLPTRLTNQMRGTARHAKDSLDGAAESLSNRAGEMSDAALEKAHEFKDAAGEQLGHYSDEFHHLLRTSPLAMAGIAAAVGLAFGLMLPDTDMENRTLGAARDQFVDQAQERVTEVVSDMTDKAVDLKDKAVGMVGAVGESAKEKIQAQKPTNHTGKA